ncbi:MAG: class B sortase [Oscillospiraceae bacterium]|nr:class B sortase [Oscillospiraceae bacterium]
MKDDDFHFDPDDEDFWKDAFADSGLEDIDWSQEESYPPRRASRAQQEQSSRQSSRSSREQPSRQGSRSTREQPSRQGSRSTREQPSRQSSRSSREQASRQGSRSPQEQARRQPPRSSQEGSQASRSRAPSSGGSRRPAGQGGQSSRPRASGQPSRAAGYDQRGQRRPQGDRSGRSYEDQARSRSYNSRRRRQRRNVPLIVLAVVLAVGMVVAGWQLISILLNYQRDRSAYNDLAANAISALAETEDETVTDTTEAQETEESDSSYVPIIVDWEYLESINTDIVGWLYCPDTVINYPVVQASDNEYYLKRGFNGESNTSGTLFADVSSVMGINMCNFIVYGHNMKDGSMLGTIEGYVDQSYYEEHPVMYYLTPTETYRIDLIAAHIVESTLDNYPGYFDSTTDYQTYLNKITSASLFATNATVSTDYQLITLSTCDYSSSYNDPRFLLHGLLVPIE